MRSYLFEAAGVLLPGCSAGRLLKAWAVRLAQRSGFNKARVALARKLAVILHAIWRTGEPFRWTKWRQLPRENGEERLSLAFVMR